MSVGKFLRYTFIAILVVGLPVLMWAVLTQRIELRKRASTAEQGVCIPVNLNVFVSPPGGPGSCHDIQKAVDAVTGPNYTIHLAPGTYPIADTGEAFSINIAGKQNISILADTATPANPVVLLFNGNQGGIHVSNSSGRIEGTVQSNETASSLKIIGHVTNGMVRIFESNHFNLSYTEVNNTSGHTIDVNGGSTIALYGLHVSSSAGGVEISNVQDFYFDGNTVDNTATGLWVNNVSGSIQGNLFTANNEHAMLISGVNSLTIRNNTIVHNRATNTASNRAVSIMDPDINNTQQSSGSAQSSMTFLANIIAFNDGYGLVVDAPAKVNVALNNNNFFQNNGGNVAGSPDQPGQLGNISADPLFGPNFCLSDNSPVFYGTPDPKGAYMGAFGLCGTTNPPIPTPSYHPIRQECSPCRTSNDCTAGLICQRTQLQGVSSVCLQKYPSVCGDPYLGSRCVKPDGTSVCTPGSGTTPVKPPPGCRYEQVACAAVIGGPPCPNGPILICPSGTPTPTLTPTPTPISDMLSPGVYQETESRLHYTGKWTTSKNKAMSGGAVRITKDPKGQVAFNFQGYGVTIFRSMGTNRGVMSVCVDNVCQDVNSKLAKGAKYNEPFTVPVTFGLHQVVVKNTSAANIDIDRVEILGAPTPTPTPIASQILDFKLKLAGVDAGTAENAKVAAKMVFSDGTARDLGVMNLLYLGNGVYIAKATITNPPSTGTLFRVILKGEKHVAVKFCALTGQTGGCGDTQWIVQPNPTPTTLSFDFTGLALPPGDLPVQDGREDAADFAKLNVILTKSPENVTTQDKITADVNYDGAVNIRDAFLMVQTLSVRYDEQ